MSTRTAGTRTPASVLGARPPQLAAHAMVNGIADRLSLIHFPLIKVTVLVRVASGRARAGEGDVVTTTPPRDRTTAGERFQHVTALLHRQLLLAADLIEDPQACRAGAEDALNAVARALEAGEGGPG